MSHQDREKVKLEIQKLEDWPTVNVKIKQMVGEWKGCYRIRVGKLRIIFWPDNKKEQIFIDHIGPRGDRY